MRHGEAEPYRAGDHTRVLTALGQSQAARVAHQLMELSLGRVGILSSDAARAKETAEIVARTLRTGPVEFFPEFYSGNHHDILRAIEACGDDFETIIVVGHNPVWSEATGIFSDRGVSLGTADAAILELSDEQADDWRVYAQDFRLGQVVRP
jgi:phosphohistidine phosphatase